MQHAVPRRGAWAVMTIDPVASLEYLRDPQVPGMCARLVNQDYIVYVTDGYNQPFNPHLPYQMHIVEFLIHGRPPELLDMGIDSSMSIPVFNPASEPNHTFAVRKPLHSSNVIPWENCYLSPFVTAEVRCPTLVNDDPITHYLDIPEQLRHDKFVREDMHRRREVMNAWGRHSTHSSDFSVYAEPADWCETDVTGHQWVRDYSAARTLYRNADATGTTGEHSHDPHDQPAVTFHHDLSHITALYSPLDFYAEEDALRNIAAVSRLRREHCIIENTYSPKPERPGASTKALDAIAKIGRLNMNVFGRIFAPRNWLYEGV